MALNQLRLLLWKNLFSQIRRPKQVACIVIIPLICLVLLAFVSLQLSIAKRFTEHGENNLDPFSPDYLDSQLLSVVAGEDYDPLAVLNKKAVLKVYYTPKNTVTRSLLERVEKKLKVKIKGKIFLLLESTGLAFFCAPVFQYTKGAYTKYTFMYTPRLKTTSCMYRANPGRKRVQGHYGGGESPP